VQSRRLLTLDSRPLDAGGGGALPVDAPSWGGWSSESSSSDSDDDVSSWRMTWAVPWSDRSSKDLLPLLACQSG
jgi:hypothetical protein